MVNVDRYLKYKLHHNTYNKKVPVSQLTFGKFCLNVIRYRYYSFLYNHGFYLKRASLCTWEHRVQLKSTLMMYVKFLLNFTKIDTLLGLSSYCFLPWATSSMNNYCIFLFQWIRFLLAMFLYRSNDSIPLSSYIISLVLILHYLTKIWTEYTNCSP